jgi:hypothetical protein
VRYKFPVDVLLAPEAEAIDPPVEMPTTVIFPVE